jgi:hypothetical protein
MSSLAVAWYPLQKADIFLPPASRTVSRSRLQLLTATAHKDNSSGYLTNCNWVRVSCYDRRSVASLSWNKASIWCLRQDFYYCQMVASLLIWGALSDERTVLSFTIAAGPRQRTLGSESRGTRHHILLSDSRLPFSLPPRTRRATVEVFDPTSTQATNCLSCL